MQIRVLAIFKLKTLSDWPQKFPAFQLFAPIYAVPRFFEFGSFYNTTYICDKNVTRNQQVNPVGDAVSQRNSD
jgi:hypothetical protein